MNYTTFNNRRISVNLPILFILAITVVLGITLIGSYNKNRFANLTQIDESSAASGFSETFDGFPAAPEAFTQLNQSRWDVAVHSRDGYWTSSNTWNTLEPMNAHHGADCSKPVTDTSLGNPTIVTHALNGVYEDHVYKCRDHVMTSMNASGYGLVALTPNSMADFSNAESVIKFDMSTWRSSGRDWVDIWVTPYQENIQLPFDQSTLGVVDLQGTPRNAVHVSLNLAKNSFDVQVIRNGVAQKVNSNCGDCVYDSWLTQDAARRDTFELRLSRTHVKFGMPTYDKWWVDSAISDVGFSQGVVQFAQHSYNPTKDCGVANKTGPDGQCKPNTWHWDNISITPAVPFTMIKGDKRYAENNQVVTFKQPAPANAYLRFSGIGKIAVSFNGGAFQAARKQATSDTGAPEHFSNYWMPVPEGTQTVTFQIAADSYVSSSQLRAKDFAIWSLQNSITATIPPVTNSKPVPSGTSSQSTMTAMPLPSMMTHVSPTATPSPVPTRTATPSPILTASPKATAGPTVKPLPSTTTLPVPTQQPAPTDESFVGEYYNSRIMTGAPAFVRQDPKIAFNWASGSPASAIRNNRFSVRWTKNDFFEDRYYVFTTRSDDGIRIKIDDKTIASYWWDHAASTQSTRIRMISGVHKVVVEYYENWGLAEAAVSWKAE